MITALIIAGICGMLLIILFAAVWVGWLPLFEPRNVRSYLVMVGMGLLSAATSISLIVAAGMWIARLCGLQ